MDIGDFKVKVGTMDDNVTLSDSVMHSLILHDYGIELSKSAGIQR